MKIADVISQLVDEKDIDSKVLTDIVCDSMLLAYQKKYPELVLKVKLDDTAGALRVFVQKKVVSSVVDPETEISLRKARSSWSNVALGDEVWCPFDGTIGRVEILRAKQAITTAIRKLDAEAIYEAFKEKEGAVIPGVVHKLEHNGVLVKVQGDVLGFLPKSLSVPGERLASGHPIRALLKEVLEEPRGENQLILDRASPDFLRELLSVEIPEIFDGLVEVKKIVRAPGYKSKIAVVSHDPNIDPVGTCVGVGGARIRPVLKELGGEKIDVIQWSESLDKFVKDALKPAKVNKAEVLGNAAQVWLDDDQRSLAIGRHGKNIDLASQLTGVSIQLVGGGGVNLDEMLTEE